MFGIKKTLPIRTLIGEGTVFQGDIRFTDGLRIDGEVFVNGRHVVANREVTVDRADLIRRLQPQIDRVRSLLG